jgi:hypothetical protein
VAGQALDPNDQAALNRRAERFQREHDLERQKSMRNGGAGGSGQASLKANYQNAHLFNGRSQSRSASPSIFTNMDDPEVNPVGCSPVKSKFVLTIHTRRTSPTGIDIPLLEHLRKYSKIISV